MNKSVRIDDEKELCTEVASLMMIRTRMMMMMIMMVMMKMMMTVVMTMMTMLIQLRMINI